MTGLAPSRVPSRLNVGGYGVQVAGIWWDFAQRDPGRFHALKHDLWCSGRLDKPDSWIDIEQAFTRLAGTFAPGNRSATVGPDGSLRVEREPWAARHYRRAVMNGAGVYRLGLWAFLGARQRYTFTAPTPGASVEPHAVTVRGFIWRQALVRGKRVEQGEWVTRVKSEPTLWCTAEVGEATPKGFTPGRHDWRGAQYRRAVMSGAGVFRLGLWSMLAQREAAATVEAANGAMQLDAFSQAAHRRVRPSVRWRTPKRERQHRKRLTLDTPEFTGRPWGTYRGRRPKRKGYRHHEHMKGHFLYLVASMMCVEEGSEYDIREQCVIALDVLRSTGKLPRTCTGKRCNTGSRFEVAMSADNWAVALGLFPDLFREYKNLIVFQRKTLAPILAAIDAQAARYRAYLARQIRVQRAPTCAPRPLYTLAVPPAVPLAPPALA